MFVKLFSAAVIAAAIWGCSSANPDSPMLNASGKHPSGWIALHGQEFLRDKAQCATCHGSSTVKAQSGGVSGVSCFSTNFGAQLCHPGGPVIHPAGWQAPALHGRAGAMAAPSATTGFASCTVCHGILYTGNGAAVSCMKCHTLAPHPDTPWHGTTATGTNHVFTDPGNATECAKCHRNGANLTTLPAPPLQPAATPAGCFNNTLCHDPGVFVHPAGWSISTVHGAAAKAAVTVTSGFGYCKSCHGANYAGSATVPDCFGCHGTTTAPHPLTPWIGAPTHTDTNQTNARFCAQCHRNGANLTSIAKPPLQPATTPAGCFNNTLCHAVPGAGGANHLVPFNNHNMVVILAGGNTTCLVCHAVGTAASVYPAPVIGNPPDCRGCHQKAAPLIATISGNVAGANCSSCHGTGSATAANLKGRPSGSAFPDTQNRHSSNGTHSGAACSKCHNLGIPGALLGGTGSGINHGRGSTAGPVRDGKPDVVGPFTTGITVNGSITKGVAPSITCNHNATLGGGCGNGAGTQNW